MNSMANNMPLSTPLDVRRGITRATEMLLFRYAGVSSVLVTFRHNGCGRYTPAKAQL